MRPEISSLIRETIYPRLLDQDDTKDLPNVVWYAQERFFFLGGLDHDNVEESAQADAHQKSHSNIWEVEMMHTLVRHMVRQGI